MPAALQKMYTNLIQLVDCVATLIVSRRHVAFPQEAGRQCSRFRLCASSLRLNTFPLRLNIVPHLRICDGGGRAVVGRDGETREQDAGGHAAHVPLCQILVVPLRQVEQLVPAAAARAQIGSGMLVLWDLLKQPTLERILQRW